MADLTYSERANAYHQSEVKAWVKAHRERGVDIAKLDEHELRMECYAELNKQLVAEGVPRFKPPTGSMPSY